MFPLLIAAITIPCVPPLPRMPQGADELRAADRSPELAAPFRLTAAGQPIVPGSGHGKPYVVDWDGDGVRDLLVGQFGEGRLRIHLNRSGEDGVWELARGKWLYANGHLASVPFG